MSDYSLTEMRLGLLLTLRRLAASVAIDPENRDGLDRDDAAVIKNAEAALATAIEKLRLMPGGDELAITILKAAEELAARAPLDEIRQRVYTAPIQRKINSAAGKARANKLARTDEETKHPHVIELAKEVLAINPNHSNSRLADLVHDR